MNTKSVLLGGFCFLCVILAAGFYARKAELEREQAAMRAEIEALAQTAAAARAQQPTDDEPYQRLTQNERMELMRLRNEVTQLRATASAARDALKAALQNRPIPETHPTHHVVQPTEVVANGESNPQETESYDPLAFYRKNPELMKRYFPHLYKAEVENPQIQPETAAETAPEAPADPLAFYRNNPQLMKRYFPHLVNGSSPPQSEPPADQTPPPPAAPQ